MMRTQISVDEETYERVKVVAQRRGISLAELMRRALADLLAREPEERPWTRLAGALDGESGDSESVDAVVYGRPEP